MLLQPAAGDESDREAYCSQRMRKKEPSGGKGQTWSTGTEFEPHELPNFVVHCLVLKQLVWGKRQVQDLMN